MKFIIDEQLPFSLCLYLRDLGFDCTHVNTLRSGQKMSDESIVKLSMHENLVVISKDSDFLKRFLIKREPHKLLFITTGNIKNKDLITLFGKNFQTLLNELEHNDVIEMSRDSINVLL